MITIEQTIIDKKLQYTVFENEKKLATLKGQFQNATILWLSRYEVLKNADESTFLSKLQEKFRLDCHESKLQILMNHHEKTAATKQFMDTSNFAPAEINYIFEHDLKDITAPKNKLSLVPFKEVSLAEYQQFYYESAEGDPKIDLSKWSAQTYFEQDKKELEQIWDEGLMYLVCYKSQKIGILVLRVLPHPVTKEKEGAINYMGLIGSQRKKGYGKDLHLIALNKLKSLGSKSYFGGTDSTNTPMLNIFHKNNCKKAEEQFRWTH